MVTSELPVSKNQNNSKCLYILTSRIRKLINTPGASSRNNFIFNSGQTALHKIRVLSTLPTSLCSIVMVIDMISPF